jgi:hypothetical protein
MLVLFPPKLAYSRVPAVDRSDFDRALIRSSERSAEIQAGKLSLE